MGACPSPSSHRGQPRECIARAPGPPGRVRGSGRTAVTGQIDVGAARLHGGLQVLAPGLRLVPRIAEGRSPELRQDPHRARESGITDGDDELELAPPCLAVGPLRGGQLLRRGPPSAGAPPPPPPTPPPL